MKRQPAARRSVLGVFVLIGSLLSPFILPQHVAGESSARESSFGVTVAVGAANQLANASRVEGAESIPQLRWHEDLSSGWQEAKRTGRPMLIFITSESCTYCDAMKRNTLCDTSVRKKLIERFVPIRLRPNSNASVLSRVKVSVYPTTLVAHPRGKVLAHRIGYQPPKEFCDLLKEAGSTANGNSPTALH